ncbi:AMP-binding protein [Streptomyces sp. 5-8]|uniref:AMP-binding protein n=1 Tax=Streptomyces musisoli TaxID=2802280 RepID=A0ABS1P8X5_9ACTN|nr:AMP-binding protein [Streptomyces musisoli]MBL1108827.1 AMP-binding protein [Streptomyces musisoli]
MTTRTRREGYESQGGPVEGYRLSYQQQRLWRLAELHASPGWAQLLLAVDGDLDGDRLAAALRETANRHEILRAACRRVPGVRTALLVVQDTDPQRPQWSVEDLHHLDEAAQERRIDEEARALRNLPYGAPGDPVLRAILFALGPRRHSLLLATTPLTADGRTLRLLAGELAARYADRPPTEEVLQYSQFTEWQHQEFGAPPPLTATHGTAARRPAMPLRRHPGTGVPDRGTVTASLPDGLTAAVHAYARRRRVRPGAVLLACWQTLLSRIGGEDDVTVATLFSGRDFEETTNCLGPFAQWTDVTARLAPVPVLDALAARAERALTEAEEHVPDSPAPALPAPAGHGIGFVCDETTGPVPAAGGPGHGATFRVLWDDVETERHALRLTCALGDRQATTTWHYDAEQFHGTYVRVLAGQYATLLAGLLAAPAAPVHEARLEPAAAPRRTPPRAPSAGQVLHGLVEGQARRTPDALAVVAGNERLTFRELEARADRWSRVLRARGVGLETPVAVSAAHSASLVVALLAVLKAGGTYVPLDPELPALRATELLERGGCRLLLTDRPPRPPAAERVEYVDLRALPAEDTDPAAEPAPTGEPGPDHLAYIMFTSGSTGEPKGVMLPHRAVCDYLMWSARAYTDGGEGDGRGRVRRSGDGDAEAGVRGDGDGGGRGRSGRHGGGPGRAGDGGGRGGRGRDGGDVTGGALAHSSIGFDLTVTSLFLPLITGRPVHLDPACRDALVLSSDLADRSGLDVLKLTPSHLKVVNHGLAEEDFAGTATSLVVGGEALDAEAVAAWRTHAPDTRVFNEYGPTETAVGVCVHEVGPADVSGPVPIGRPMDHAEVLVLDDSLEPAPVGVPGEIYIGGTSLARGYLGAPDLTAERFVPHPFGPEPGSRLYRTGDLACVGPDGLIRYLGRVDDQLKVNGIRVEPEEVRSVLVRHPGVRDAAVALVSDEARGDHLAACVVTGPAGPVPDLRDFAAERLPAPLVPRTFAEVAALPLTPNGKVDPVAVRAALTGADGTGPDLPAPGRTGTAPGDPVEAAVARVFGELLGTGPVGAEDDFFALGGHSLLAVRLIARLNAEFGTALQVPVLFSEPEPEQGGSGRAATVRHLARLLKEGGATRPGAADDAVRGAARPDAAEDAARGAARSGAAEDVVALRPRGEGVPLFCVHPAGGEVTGFRHLAAGTELQRPLYALRSPSAALDEQGQEEAAHYTVEALAARYLAAVRTVAPTGPYLLLGWSMGGLVAFEMARLLEQQGERPGMLFLVESYPADRLSERDDSEDQEEPGLYGGPHEAATAAERLHLELRRRTNRAHLRAARAYRPAPYAGPVTLVQADKQDPDLLAAATHAWTSVCAPGQLTRHVLEGDHLTLFEPPYVTELAHLITRTTHEQR